MALWTFAACTNEEDTPQVVEGQPASLSLSVSVPKAREVVTKASDEQETRVEKLALLFYKATQTNQLPVVVEITNIGQPTSTYSPTERTYTVNVQVDDPHLTSGQWYLYGVANYNNKYIDVTLNDLKSMTKAEMDNFCVNGAPDLDFAETAIVMSGKYEWEGGEGQLSLEPGRNTLQGASALVLRRMISKQIIEFQNGPNVRFIPESYDLYQYSTSSTLMERSGWGGEAGFTDPASLRYMANGESLQVKRDIPIVGNKFFFYTQENAQPIVGITDKNLREQHVEGDHDRFKYAPEGATYVVVKGRYEGPGKYGSNVTGTVEYTIHLGDFSSTGAPGNFAIRRNTRYKYEVTVNGVNNIITEAQAESESDDFQHGAEGDILNSNNAVNVHIDAHYEQVLLQLEIDQQIESFGFSINTPYTNKVITNLSDFADSDDISWIEFGKPASSTTFKSYTELKRSEKLCNIKQLIGMLKNPTHPISRDYLLIEGNRIYVTAYVNEYYYEGKDIKGFVNAADREMVFSTITEVSPDGHSSYTTQPIFSIRQRSIKSPTSLDLVNPLGIETLEETPSMLPAYLSYTFSGTKYWGWKNSMNILNGKGTNLRWADFINESKNGYINGVISKDRIMQPDFNNLYYHFLSRNRDNDGDGIIDQDEIRWFLPAHDECLSIWYGHSALPVEARFRINASNADRATVKADSPRYLTSSAGTKAVWWSDEGVAFGQIKSDKCSIRTVRMLGQGKYGLEMSKLWDYDSDTRTITVGGIADGGIREGLMWGDYVPHYVGDYADQLPRAFQVSKMTFMPMTVSEAAGLTERGLNISDIAYPMEGVGDFEDDPSTQGQWRVPNEKELGLILACLPADEIFNYTVARTRYKRPGETRDFFYYTIRENVGEGTSEGFNGHDSNVTPFITTDYPVTQDSQCHVIFVRDVTPRSY